MTSYHVLALVLGVIVAIVVADVLGHRGVGTWPLGILVIVMVVIAGYLYSPWIAAASLGLGIGTLALTLTAMVRRISSDRRRVREVRSARDAEARRRVDG